jgi:CBS domain-containing protein
MAAIDTDGDGLVDFEEFVAFAKDAEKRQKEQDKIKGRKPSTMIIIGRVKAGVNMKSVKLNKLFEPFGGGGHAKAASATVRLSDEGEAEGILQGIVDELIETSLMQQPTVGEFMTAPVQSAKPHMTEKQVEDMFTRYDLRALPVVDDSNDVIGLVTYKEVAAAKQRLWNKEQKKLRQEVKREAEGQNKRNGDTRKEGSKSDDQRKLGSALRGWMKHHVKVVEASTTMAEAESILLANDGTFRGRPSLIYMPHATHQFILSRLHSRRSGWHDAAGRDGDSNRSFATASLLPITSLPQQRIQR